MDRLEAMSVLLAAVDAGSLSGASRKLGMPLASVSRKVSELETHLRTQLLHRTSRRLTLTEAGRAYVAACKDILAGIEEAERAAMGEYSAPRGDLTLSAPIAFGRLHVLPVVGAFLALHPDINVRMVLTDRIVNIVEEHFDLAIRIGELPDSSLVARRVGATHQVLCASPRYLAQHGTPEHPGDLARHSCITFEGLASAQAWTFELGNKRETVIIRSRLTVNTAEAAIDAAIASVGVTRVFSYQAAHAIHEGSLSVVLRAFEPAPSPISLVHGEQPRLPQKLRAFLDFAAPRLKATLLKNAV